MGSAQLENNNIIDFHQDSLQFNEGAVITEDGREIPITETLVQQSLRELESVWMAHHQHYADTLDSLMSRVNAARGVV